MGALVPLPKPAMPARKSVPCGVGEESPHPHPTHRGRTGSGPRSHAPRTGRWERESPTPDTPHRGTRRSHAGALLRPRQCTTPACKSVCCGVGDGLPDQHPFCPKKKGSGLRVLAQNTSSLWRASAQPRTFLMQARGAPPPGRPPAAPRAHNASWQERAPCVW